MRTKYVTLRPAVARSAMEYSSNASIAALPDEVGGGVGSPPALLLLLLLLPPRSKRIHYVIKLEGGTLELRLKKASVR